MIRLCRQGWEQPGFAQWRAANINRHALIHRLGTVDVPGISVKLEAQDTDLEVHDARWTNRLDAAERIIQAAAYSSKPQDVAEAQTAENFLRAYFAHAAKSPADRRRKGQMVRYGMGPKRLCFTSEIIDALKGAKDAAEMAEIIQEKEFSVNIFRSECPDIQAIAWEPNFSRVYELGERKYSELLHAFPDLEGEYADSYSYLTSLETAPEGSSDYQKMIKYYHLEDGEYIYDVFEGGTQGQMLQCYPNPLGKPWYTFAAGNETPELAPVERYRPLIGPLYSLCERRELLETLVLSGALATGRPVYQEVKTGGRSAAGVEDFLGMPQEERPNLKFDLMDDAILTPRDGYEYKAFPTPPMEWVVNKEAQLRQEIMEKGFPAPLSPDQSMTAAASSGAQAAYGIEQAKFFIDPPLRNLARADVDEALIILGLIRELKLKVAIRGLPSGVGSYRELVRLDGSKIKEYDISCSFDAKTATMEYAESENDARRLQLGLMSRKRYMSHREADPLEEEEQIKREQMEMELDKMALADATQIINETRQDLMAQAAQQAQLPLPPPVQPTETNGLAPQSGGPAPGDVTRDERPPMGSFEGLGAPQREVPV